jgi:hypothetical protein
MMAIPSNTLSGYEEIDSFNWHSTFTCSGSFFKPSSQIPLIYADALGVSLLEFNEFTGEANGMRNIIMSKGLGVICVLWCECLRGVASPIADDFILYNLARKSSDPLCQSTFDSDNDATHYKWFQSALPHGK